MRLIVGLGNPGREYQDTRHNAGFMVADLLAERAGGSFSERKFKALLARGRLGREDCWLMKPQTFMNCSGESVGPALGFFKLTTEELIVVHDDMDIPVGRLKLKQGGGHGGHNGLRSLAQHLPDANYVRVRFGVGRPPAEWDPADYVLSRFAKAERSQVESALNAAADAVEHILRDGLRKAMNEYNRGTERGGETKEDADGQP